MGLYRTIPQDVEAVQFTGMNGDEPVFTDMGPSMPSWMWKAITKGIIKFDSTGIKVHNHILQPGDWLVMDGPFLATMDNEKFNGTYVPARKPLAEMKSAVRPKSKTKAPAPEVAAETAIPDAEPAMVAAEVTATAPTPAKLGVDTDQIPDDVDAILDRLNGNQHPEVAQ